MLLDEMAEQGIGIEKNRMCDHLSVVAFEKLLELKNHLGTKVYNEAIFVGRGGTSGQEHSATKRMNKNRPREISSKRPVSLLGAAAPSVRLSRDPRFDERCGAFIKSTFTTNYEFVSNIQKKEIRELRAKARKTTAVEKKKLLTLAAQRLENKCHEEKRRKDRLAVLQNERVENRRTENAGKKQWQKTKSERRLNELVSQYEELKKLGKLEKHIERRRKKNMVKDRKRLA